jgi:hypothetical protein
VFLICSQKDEDEEEDEEEEAEEEGREERNLFIFENKQGRRKRASSPFFFSIYMHASML